MSRWWVPVAAIGLAAVVFLTLWVRHLGGDVSRLVVAGDAFVDTAASPPCLAVNAGSGGYDGQFYYRLALAPLSTAPALAGIRFDYPIYRAQRIVYPVVAGLLARGDACRLLWTLPLVNVLALMLLVGIGAQYLIELELPPLAAFALGLWPGFLFSLARDTTEPLATALLLAGIIDAVRRRPIAIVWLSLAGLTRETTLVAAVVIGGFGVVESVRRRRPDLLLLVGAVPPLVYVLWKRWLFWWWDAPVNWGFGRVPSAPLVAPFTLFRESLAAGTHSGRVQAIEIVLLFAFAVLVVGGIARSRAPLLLKACCAAWFLLVASLSRDIWIEDWAFLRTTAEFGVLGTAVLIFSRPVARYAFAAAIALGSTALAFEMLAFR